MILIHEQLSKLDLNKNQMDFDAISLHHSAMWDIGGVYPKKESSYTFKPHMKDVFVNIFNNKTFNEDGDDSALLKIIYYNPPSLIFQHLPINEKVKIIEVNRLRIGYIIDTLTSIDLREVVKIGGKVIQIMKVLFIEKTSR